MHTTPSAVAQSTGFLGLLAHYISGAISEQTWRNIMGILDDAELSPDERVAIAFYLNEFLAKARESVSKPWRSEPAAGEWGAPAHS